MLFWVVIVALGFPLVFFILQSKKAERARQRRLDQIQTRLREKQIQNIEEKQKRIAEKSE